MKNYRKAKKSLSERCHEIEALKVKHDSFYMHKKAKKLVVNHNHKGYIILVDEYNNILTSTEKRLK